MILKTKMGENNNNNFETKSTMDKTSIEPHPEEETFEQYTKNKNDAERMLWEEANEQKRVRREEIKRHKAESKEQIDNILKFISQGPTSTRILFGLVFILFIVIISKEIGMKRDVSRIETEQGTYYSFLKNKTMELDLKLELNIIESKMNHSNLIDLVNQFNDINMKQKPIHSNTSSLKTYSTVDRWCLQLNTIDMTVKSIVPDSNNNGLEMIVKPNLNPFGLEHDGELYASRLTLGVFVFIGFFVGFIFKWCLDK